MKKYFYLFLCLILLGVLSYKASYAFFASSASSNNNTFAAAQNFPTSIIRSGSPTPTLAITPTSIPPTEGPTATPTPVLHILINEVSPDGTNNKDWVELFNPTNSAIDVSGWTITDNNSFDTFPTVAPIPALGFAVVIANPSLIVVPGTAETIQLNSTTIGNGLAQAGDRVILKDASVSHVIVDQMSWGSDTSIFASPPVAPGTNKTISRIPNGFNTSSSSDWQVTNPTLGVSN